MSQIWVVQYAGMVGLDAFRSVKPAESANHCRVVAISDDDYDRFLGPCLAPDRLSAAIKAILRFEPAVLAVDIDTSARRFRDIVTPTSLTRIVWARASKRNARGWAATDVLGHRLTDPPYWGMTLFPQDPDSSIRGFQRWVELTNGTAPSLHWQILRAYCDYGSQGACAVIPTAPKSDFSIRDFSHNYRFVTIALGDILANADRDVSPPVDNALRSKIVVLGASTSDDHVTPFGIISGAELTALAIENELDHARSRHIGVVLKHASKIVLALVLAWFYHFFKPRVALIATIILLGIVVAASFFAYYYASLHVDFIPFLVGIWVEQLYDSSQHG
jgi:CHASE2 domain-containing sensor protein